MEVFSTMLIIAPLPLKDSVSNPAPGADPNQLVSTPVSLLFSCAEIFISPVCTICPS